MTESHQRSKRQEALDLAEQVLGDIEFGRLGALDIARKVSRLARLLDDAEAIVWLSYETGGYPDDSLDSGATRAAARSNRSAGKEKGYWTGGLGTLELETQTMSAEIAALAGPVPAGDWAFRVSMDRTNERNALRQRSAQQRTLLDKVLGSLHAYAAERYQELRFGSVVETAFEVVRAEVDAAISEIAAEALPMLTAAFENASSDQPEHWSNAAATCRRLLKLIADSVRPAGPDKSVAGGRPIRMGDGNYINRLVDWVVSVAPGQTLADIIQTDLEYLGRRLDAADGAGQKGAHAHVDRFEASRFITGTYLLVGDLLRLRNARGTDAEGTTA